MKKQMPYSAPEGYFEGLQQRLTEIPASRRHFNLTPYLALAASFAILLAVGNFILSRSAQSAQDEDMIIEYLIESGTTLAMLEAMED